MKRKILEIINKNGIRDAGFCAFDLVKERLLPCRAMRRLPENAKKVILLLFPYKVRDAHPENICRYAAVPDYHDITQKYLLNITDDLKKEFPEYKFESFADNSPIPEVSAAAAAGLGVYGENGLLINKTYGSWCFICEIVTDLEIPAGNAYRLSHSKKKSLILPKNQPSKGIIPFGAAIFAPRCARLIKMRRIPIFPSLLQATATATNTARIFRAEPTRGAGTR